MPRCCLVLLLSLCWPGALLAHKPSDSYLSLHLDQVPITLRWDIALRDLERVLGLDQNQDGAITWGELRSRRAAIEAHALSRLTLSGAQGDCNWQPGSLQVDRHSDGAYAVLNVTAACPTPPRHLEYRLLFRQDPTHRGLVKVHYPDRLSTAVLSPDEARLDLRTPPGHWQQFVHFWREGVWHIWIGFDHILFLLALLLPAALRREQGRWQRVASPRQAIIQVAWIVTAFTVAHSITLAAAVLGWVNLPSRLVESAIAATVVLAALNNLRPVLPGRAWVLAFTLGLIHGVGFAGVLSGLGLPPDRLALALLGFNLGVETGQLAIVALLLPLAFALGDGWFYRRAVLQGGSVVVAGIAVLWLLERSLDMRLPLP